MRCVGSHIAPVLTVIFMLAACGGKVGNKNIVQETPTAGSIQISVDESFKPVIDAEIKVFTSSFPNAKLQVHYKSEAACFSDLAADSTRMIIVTRGLSKEEEKYYLDLIHFVPVYGKLAYDAIAVIVNNASKDSLLTMSDITALLESKGTSSKQVVMDGVTATSTVRYAMDSILRGRPLGKQVMAARSSEAVINFVAKNLDAIGFIGVSWIGDQDDPDQLAYLEKVKVVAVKCEGCAEEAYLRPYQANIALKRYPMIRGLFYILKEDFKGVGNNFVNFLQFERGQLIFRRAYLMPSRMSFEIRNMQITN